MPWTTCLDLDDLPLNLSLLSLMLLGLLLLSLLSLLLLSLLLLSLLLLSLLLLSLLLLLLLSLLLLSLLDTVWQGLDYEKKLRQQRDRLGPSIGSEARWRQTAKMSKNRRSGWGGEGFRRG